MKCPVCHNPISSDTKFCSICRFDELQQEFITEADAEYWYQNKVLPYRTKWRATLSELPVSERCEDRHNGKNAEELAHKTTGPQEREEAECQKIEVQKRKKRIISTVICGIIVALIIITVSLPSWIENKEISRKESVLETQIQNIILSLEKEIESKISDDVIIDYSFSLENDWDDEQWYEWTFSIKLQMLEDYRKAGSSDDQMLLEIMDNCKVLNEIYDDIYDDLDLDFKYEDIRMVVDYQGGNMGALKIRDLSSYETFYYEEYWGNRYLHSFNTEYVLPNNG